MTIRLVQGQPQPVPRQETEEQRRARVTREAELIAEARAELDAGLGIEDDQLEAWLDQLEHDSNAPIPTPRRVGAAPAPGL